MKALALVIRISLRQLWARRLLNAIAACGVALGVLVFVTVGSLFRGEEEDFKAEMMRVTPHVTLYDRELSTSQRIAESVAHGPMVYSVIHDQPVDRSGRIDRPSEIVRSIEAIPGVVAACPTVTGNGTALAGARDRTIDLRGVIPMDFERCTNMSRFVQSGSWVALAADPNSIAIGTGLANHLGVALGDHISVVAPGGPVLSLRIAAIFETTIIPIDNTRVFANLSSVQVALRRHSAINRIEVRLEDPFESRLVATRLEAVTGYDAESWQEANENYLKIFATEGTIASMVSGAILAVGGFGILAIQIMLVLQKVRDISILRSVGLRRRDILVLFILQGACIAVVGAMLGSALGWGAVELLGSIEVPAGSLVKRTTYSLYRGPDFYVYGTLFALFTGTVASLIPAWRGSRVEPVDVLRGQVG